MVLKIRFIDQILWRGDSMLSFPLLLRCAIMMKCQEHFSLSNLLS